MSKRTQLLSKLKHVYSHNTKLVLDVSNDDIGLIIEGVETKIELNKRNLTPDILEKYMKFEDECIKKDFTFESLIEAREKQIGKKIERYSSNIIGEMTFNCPSCKLEYYVTDYEDFNYCPNCGQKIDWSETDD